jgi:hypothetical protein
MPEAWTLRYSLPGVGGFPCGEGGNGDRVRFTIPGARVAYVGAVPARDTMFVSDRMTLFDLDVRFAYGAA